MSLVGGALTNIGILIVSVGFAAAGCGSGTSERPLTYGERPAPCAVPGLACEFWVNSGFYGVPLPGDGVETFQDGDPEAFVTFVRNVRSSAGSVHDVTNFYYDHMTDHGFDPLTAGNQLDPAELQQSGGGYRTLQYWASPDDNQIQIIVGAQEADDPTVIISILIGCEHTECYL